jgi:carbonic anhydrase
MATFTDEELHAKLRAETDAAEVDALRFHTFTDVEQRVQESVRRISESPLFPDGYGVAGLVFEVETGRLRVVA